MENRSMQEQQFAVLVTEAVESYHRVDSSKKLTSLINRLWTMFIPDIDDVLHSKIDSELLQADFNMRTILNRQEYAKHTNELIARLLEIVKKFRIINSKNENPSQTRENKIWNLIYDTIDKAGFCGDFNDRHQIGVLATLLSQKINDSLNLAEDEPFEYERVKIAFDEEALAKNIDDFIGDQTTSQIIAKYTMKYIAKIAEHEGQEVFIQCNNWFNMKEKGKAYCVKFLGHEGCCQLSDTMTGQERGKPYYNDWQTAEEIESMGFGFGFHLGNVHKYWARWRKESQGQIDDLTKMRDHLDRAIMLLKKEQKEKKE